MILMSILVSSMALTFVMHAAAAILNIISPSQLVNYCTKFGTCITLAGNELILFYRYHGNYRNVFIANLYYLSFLPLP